MPTKEELEAEEKAKADETTWNERFHKGSTEREKRFKTSLLKDVENLLETKFGTKFDELRQLLVDSPSGDDPNAGRERDERPGTGKLSAEAEASIRQAKQDAKEAKQLADKWQAEATAEKVRASKNEERQALVSQLNGKVKPALLDMVVDQLHAKHLTRDQDSGAILWKDEDGATLPLKEAIAAWSKSDVGKEFAPPRSVSGTGSRGPSGGGDDPATRTGPMDMEKLGNIVLGSIPGQR